MAKHTPEEMGISPVERYRQEIAMKSNNIREDMPQGDTWVETPEGKKFQIELLTDEKDPRIRGSHDLLAGQFGKNEVDGIGAIREAVGQLQEAPEDRDYEPLLVNTVQNEKGEVVATTHSAVLGTLNEDFEPTRDKGAVMLDAYTVVDKKARGQNLAYELYRRRLMDAAASAQEQGLKINSMVAETTPEGPENFYNSMGFGRLYFENKDGQLVEAPYFQSVLCDAFDPKTGKPMPGIEPSALHLMIAKLDGNKHMTIEEVLRVVRSIMNYDSYNEAEYFDKANRKKAFAEHERILNDDLERFEDALSQAKDGTIMLMSAEERETWLKERGQKSEITHVPPPEKK